MEKFNLDMEKRYSYADYLKWSFDETVEIIKGIIFKMAPAPNRNHQEISGRLYLIFGNYFIENPCNLYSAPFDVRLPRKKGESADELIITVVQPDLCVICDNEKLDERGCIGAPDLIIEILSPGNSKKEMKDKFNVYEESGVREYWIVFPVEKSVIIYSLNEEAKYIGSRLYTVDDNIKSTIFPELVIELNYIFKD